MSSFIFTGNGCVVDSFFLDSEFPTALLEAKITGVKEAFANLTENGGVDPVIKATIQLSESGFISVPEVIAYVDIKDESIAGMILTTSVLYAIPDEAFR